MPLGAGRAWFIGLVGVLYILVAWRLRDRHPSSTEGQRALRAFGVWWSGVAALFIMASASILVREESKIGVVEGILAGLGMVAVCAAVWGLTTFVVFVYSGAHKYSAILRAYYALDAVFLLVALALDPPQARAWADSVADLTILTGPFVSFGIILFLVPAIMASTFYGSLYRRASTREQRLRVGLTSVAFVAWFGTAILAFVTGVARQAWWPIVGQSIGVLSTLLVVLGYWQPRWLQSREGGSSV